MQDTQAHPIPPHLRPLRFEREYVARTGYSEMVARIMYVNGRWVTDSTSCDLQYITESQLREIADFISRLDAEDQGV